jgi:hypothetical protein
MKTLGIRPIRHYRRVGDALAIEGSEGLNLQVTPADMSEVTEMVAKVRLKIPLDKQVEYELAWALKLFRATTHAVLPPEIEAHQHALNRVEKNVEELLQDLPRLIEFYRDLHFTRADASAEMFKTLLAAVRYLKVRRASWGGGPSPRRNAALWHDDAIYLSFILGTAAVRAQARLSFTKIEAPGVKFIHEALTRAGIKHGGPGAIAQAMVRYNKDRRQVRELSTTEPEKRLAISAPKGV